MFREGLKALLLTVYGFVEKTVLPAVLPVVEANLVPDPIIRLVVRALLWDRLHRAQAHGATGVKNDTMTLVRDLKAMPIAVNTENANQQHYEVSSRFYLHY